MFRVCGCFQRRRCSSDDSSSCRSSEIARGARGSSPRRPRGIIRLFNNRHWFQQWRGPGRGMSMSRIERTMKAAILIQRWYRRYLARMEIRRRYTWTIFQSIEYQAEQDQVRLYNFFNALLTHIPDNTGRHTQSQATSRSSSCDALDLKFSDESDDLGEEGIAGPQRTYKGPHIVFPLVKKDFDVIVDLFRKKRSRLHAKYVAGLLREATAKLKRMPNLNQASTAISKQVTICGDLHGKLDDLLVIFHKNGLPSAENPYVFNGDFVDRGKKSLEVFLLLLTSMLVFPGGIFLNRGNHEDSVMNARYGFIREVHQKYKHNAERLLKLIDEVYRWLPLGTIINNRVLVVHGGISDSTDLDIIRNLDRSKYVSLLRPPLPENAAPGTEIDKAEWKQVFDILWSDPQHNDGCKANSLRGAGTYFGPDVTSRFLIRNKINLIVRSHECKPDGHELMHNGKVITIFSASNYYEIGSNKGAYLKLSPEFDTHFVQYTSAASKTRKLTFRQRVGLVETSALRELGARLRECRSELEREFKLHDPEGTGKLTLPKWCEAMEAATHLGLPWRLLREKLAPLNANATTTNVSYKKTLELLDTDSIKNAQSGALSIAESLYKNKSSLEAIFRILDKDNSGQISLEEFSDACDLLRHHLPEHDTKEQLLEMCQMMDINKDGLVDLNEFLETFRLCESARESYKVNKVELPPISEVAPSTSGVAPSTSGMVPSTSGVACNTLASFTGSSGGSAASGGSDAGGETSESNYKKDVAKDNKGMGREGDDKKNVRKNDSDDEGMGADGDDGEDEDEIDMEDYEDEPVYNDGDADADGDVDDEDDGIDKERRSKKKFLSYKTLRKGRKAKAHRK